MEIYFYITQKLLPNHEIIYPNIDNTHDFYNQVYNDIKFRIENPEYYDIYNMIYHIFYKYTFEKTNFYKAKFRTLKDILENVFFSPEYKEKYFTMFSKIQKMYFALLRFCYLCKYKKSKIHVDSDLSLNPIDLVKNNKNVFVLFQNNFRYCFLLSELVHIIETAISNSPYFFISPLEPKNPYTNIPFNLSTLYNIYFKYKETKFVSSTLFHLYFLSHFNADACSINNEHVIREFAIKKYIQNTTSKELYYYVLDMLRDNFYTRKLCIHKDFPKELLASIMRPFLYYKYMYKYGITGLDKTRIYRDTLFSKLKKFYEFNPSFGRKIYQYSISSGKKIWTNSFNSKHISFYLIPVSLSLSLSPSTSPLTPPRQHALLSFEYNSYDSEEDNDEEETKDNHEEEDDNEDETKDNDEEEENNDLFS